METKSYPVFLVKTNPVPAVCQADVCTNRSDIKYKQKQHIQQFSCNCLFMMSSLTNGARSVPGSTSFY